ncbi:cytochrome c [Mycoavidus sp. B2-EB]|uniref:c-type cytochrome n=1 Tax=Mycoavidus sp. B2-EB TaxID=2651972 RepID=UPI001628D64B|nr:c-type cytochrome [Mycoavidus sp. B2-EB]BBO59157.1 cytochrome c [Mycoavidus sp. B2-EB]
MSRAYKFWQLIGVSLAIYSTVAYPQSISVKPDLARGKAIANQVCISCHSAEGSGATGLGPNLAGQHIEYLYKQLGDYKAESSAKAPKRNNPIMASFASVLSEQDMWDVSAYFAALPERLAVAHNKEMAELGQKIWRGGIAERGVPACAACHGPAGAGIPVQYPRLAGQWQDYTIAQLQAFQQGARVNNDPMQAIAERLSEKEIKALADYIAGLR